MEQCIYLPKELMTEKYRSFNAETKLLFALILSNSKTASSIIKVAELIELLGEKEINSLQKELNAVSSESESA